MAKKNADSNTSLDGIELFKSEVTKLLLAEKDHTLEVCHFKLRYKKTFGKQFNYQTYGFEKKKLTDYFYDVRDIVSFENERKFIVLKEKASVSQDKPTPSLVSSTSQSSRKDGKNVKSVQTTKTTTSNTCEATCKSATDVREKQLVSPVPPQPPSSGDSSTGTDRFKAKVKEILQDKVNCKIEIGQFVHLYKQKFKTAFDPSCYGFQRRAKVSALLGAIPDVVLLERIGSSLYMKLNNSSSSPKMARKQANSDVHSGIPTSTQAAPQVKSESDSLRTSAKHNEQELEKTRSGTERFDSTDLRLSAGSPTSNICESLPLSSSVKSENSRSMVDTPKSKLESYQKHLSMENQPHPGVVTTDLKLQTPDAVGSKQPDVLSHSSQMSTPIPTVPPNTRPPLVMPISSINPGFQVQNYMQSGSIVTGSPHVQMTPNSSLGLHHLARNTSVQNSPVATRSSLPPATMVRCVPPATTTTGLPAANMSTGLPPANISTGLPPATMVRCVPPATMTTGLPAFKMTTGLPPATMTTGLPAANISTGLPPATMVRCVPPATMTTGLPAFKMTTGLPPATMTTGLPPTTMVRCVPPATMTTGLPAFKMTTGLPPATMTTGLPPTTMVRCVPPATMTTGLPAVSSSSPGIPSKKIGSSVPSLATIMQEQQEESLEESFDFPHQPPAPSTTAKPKYSRQVINLCHDGEHPCLGSPSPFEESLKSAFDTPLATSSLKKNASRKKSPQEINELAKQIWESISDDGEHVTLETVKFRLCQRLGIKSLNELGYRKPDMDIPALKELSRLLCKLDLYARAYVMVHSISTLTELGQGMARLLDQRDFLDLQVGPLVKLPVVYDLFKAPSDDVIMQQVTTVHILKHLNQYLTKNDKWTSKVDLQDFMKYLCDAYQCATPYELGVRIQSIGLGISVLKRAQKSQSEKSKQVEQELAADMEREIEKRCRKIKDDFLGSSHGDERSLIHKLLDSSVIDIITKIFNHCQEMFKPKPFEKVNKFLTTVTSDKSFRDLFNLALHMGCKDIVKELLEDYKTELLEEERLRKLNSRAQEAASLPKKGTLLKEAKDWLNGAENLDLSTLATIEKRLLGRFPGIDVFSAFGHGTWLEFLNREKELCKLLENKGASVCGGSRNNRHRVDLNSLLDFVIQCGTRATEDMVQRALCNHYHVPSVTDLGGKSCKTLMEQSTQRKHVQQSVIYESALLCKDGDANILQHLHSNTTDEKKPRAGILGWKNPDDAVKSLASAPLLADMKEWTQWDAVFKPCLGDLKQFIAQAALKKRDDSIQVQALETEEGRLLKVNTSVNTDDLKKAIDEKDVVGSAGILVSMVIKYGGIQATPLALIINHVKSALLALASLDQGDDGKRCPRFVLQCLCRLPHRICVAVASKVFLEPLGVAVGTTLSNQLLLSCCDNYQQRCCLHQLGLALGHTEWIEDFNSMMTGETKNQVIEEERKKIFQDLRPVAVIKPVAAETIKQEEDVEEEEDVSEQEVILEEDEQVNEPSTAGETQTIEGTSENQQTLNDKEEDEEQEKEEDPCKTLIDSIRREEFGIGVTLGEEESKLVQKQREREGRSLHRLSSELYSRDTHFVLELIQNADDNTFTSDPPTLVFVIDPQVVIVLNNEVGFKEENIRALCDVGKSTKGAHQYGYIGQKGIGFKSVFRVSDRPEVHSNGYHIRFDANSGPSGYILPHWIDDHYISKLSSDIDDLQLDSWMTRIVLPLKEEFHGDKKNSLSARFNDVHPSLLLFLHRLRKIILAKKNKVQQMTRQDLGDDIVQISDSHGKKRWLVVKKQLKVMEARENVEMTELALAFPMAEQEMSSHDLHAKPLPVQNVFAYLPLRSYGFKFIIQGDFEVPSSREDVDGDKAWNQWLREEIPKLFIEALEVFKNHPHFQGLSGVAKFFQFVPLKEEILDFFNPVAEIILRYLQGMNCLPVEKVVKDVNKKGDSCQYDWMQPCKVVVCEDPDIMALISPELLYRHSSLYYLVPDLISAINPAMREELGIKTLSVKHLIDVARSVMEGDLSVQDNVKRIQWISKWLCCVYRCLEREHNSSSEILDEIAAMNIFPLSDYTFVNLRDNAIFFPLSTSQQTMKEKKKRSTTKYLQELEKDLLVLNPELLNHLESVGYSQVEKLLQQLGVKSWTAKDVIHNHILPTLKSDKWKEKTHDVLQCYLVYIFKEHLVDPTLCDLDELKGCAQVLTNKGPVNPDKTPVHFTTKYGNSLNLCKDIPNISWTLINDSYLDETPSTSRQEWEKFFTALGVQHFLVIKRKHVTLNKMTLDSSPWASYYESWPKTPDSVYVIEDFCCDELDEFMSKRVDPQQAKVLAENLDKQWKDHYSKYADKIPLRDSDGKELYGHSTLSSFILALKTRDWLPVFQSNTCSIPSKLYLRSKEVYDVLDDHVQYVGANLQVESSFARVLGVTLGVTLENLLDNLIEWSKTCQSKLADHDKGFVTSVAHMKRAYQFIYDKYKTSTSDDKSKITSAFQKTPLIFFPHESYLAKEKEDPKRTGEFHHKKEVCWKDPSCVAYELVKSRKYAAKRRILFTCYSKNYYDFFVSCLKVDLTPHSDEYIEMASVLVSDNPVPTPSVLEKMIEIFAVLGEKCLGKPLTETNYTRVDSANYAHTDLYLEEEDIDPATARYLKTKLAKEDLFPCTTRWVSLSDKPIVADNKRLKKVFDGENGVHFITLEQQKSRRHVTKSRVDEKKMGFVQVFLRACGVPKLSECVEETLTATAVAFDQCHDVQQYFHQIVPCVQRYIYHQLPDLYSKLVEDKVPKMLAKMTFAMVGKLEVVYYLKPLPQLTVAQEAKWGHENHEDRIFFYAVRNQVEIAQPLNQEIAKLFGAGGVSFDNKKFENFLELLRVNLEKDLESFLLDQEVDSLPEEEEEWYVPEPEIPKTPEIVEEEIPEPVFATEKASSREYEDDGTLHSWPPRAPATGMTTRSYPSETRPQEKALEMWPVPEAPNSVKNQITTDEVLPQQTRKHPDESYSNNDSQTTSNGAVVSHCVGTEGNRPEGNVRNNSQQSIALKDQQKIVEPNGSVQKETTNPQVDALTEDNKASAKQWEQASQQNNTVPVESFSIFMPGMQVSVQDLEFENVPSVSLPDVHVLHQNPNKDAIGRWGEQFVYEYLQSSLNPGDDSAIMIEWKNKQQNSVAPYDIEIRKKSNGAEETTFIEVKSTSGDDKEHFEISAAELKFALEQKDRLHLYRVFNAGSSENVRIQRAMNLAAHLGHKSVKLFMVL